MRILVTGKNGQLGRALAERAALETRANLQFHFLGRADLDLEQAGQFAGVIQKLAPDVVINAAAYTNVDEAEDDAEKAMLVNAAAPGRLADIIGRRGGRFVQVSTDYVFDGSKPSPYVEMDEINPQSVYGRSKAAGEMRVREACEHHVIVRTAWVYSPFGRNFPKTMLRLAREQEHIRVVADQIGSPTSAHDLADGLIAMCRYWLMAPEMGLGRTFHLAGRDTADWAGFARQVFACSKRHGGPVAQVENISTASYSTKAPRPGNSQLDCGLFRETFGFWVPGWRSSLDETVCRILAEGRI